VVRAAAASLGAMLSFSSTEAISGLCGFENKGVSSVTKGAKGVLHLEGGLRVERSAREVRFSRQ